VFALGFVFDRLVTPEPAGEMAGFDSSPVSTAPSLPSPLAFDRINRSTDIMQFPRSWAWMAALEGSWNSTDENHWTDLKITAADKVLAQFGL
jgi:hypothetical protein